jgi:hypothetical protein
MRTQHWTPEERWPAALAINTVLMLLNVVPDRVMVFAMRLLLFTPRFIGELAFVCGQFRI